MSDKQVIEAMNAELEEWAAENKALKSKLDAAQKRVEELLLTNGEIGLKFCNDTAELESRLDTAERVATAQRMRADSVAAESLRHLDALMAAQSRLDSAVALAREVSITYGKANLWEPGTLFEMAKQIISENTGSAVEKLNTATGESNGK